jgi:HTH-type transcriptional regulator / antitoxin HigA
MDATLILIDSEAELARARALVERLWDSEKLADVARLEAQARLIAAYEERKWPRRRPSTADLIRHLMDQHGLAPADIAPILGTASRVSEVLRGKKQVRMAMIQRLRARFRVPADVLIPSPKRAPGRRGAKRLRLDLGDGAKGARLLRGVLGADPRRGRGCRSRRCWRRGRGDGRWTFNVVASQSQSRPKLEESPCPKFSSSIAAGLIQQPASIWPSHRGTG